MSKKKKKFSRMEVKRLVYEWQNDTITTTFGLWLDAYIRAQKTIENAKEQCKEFGIFNKN